MTSNLGRVAAIVSFMNSGSMPSSSPEAAGLAPNTTNPRRDPLLAGCSTSLGSLPQRQNKQSTKRFQTVKSLPAACCRDHLQKKCRNFTRLWDMIRNRDSLYTSEPTIVPKMWSALCSRGDAKSRAIRGGPVAEKTAALALFMGCEFQAAAERLRPGKIGFRTFPPARMRSSSSDQNCMSETRSFQYSPRV